jgi:hypothetical protein
MYHTYCVQYHEIYKFKKQVQYLYFAASLRNWSRELKGAASFWWIRSRRGSGSGCDICVKHGMELNEAIYPLFHLHNNYSI